MGRRKRRERQKDLWVATSELPKSAGHPFYLRLSELLDEHGFDAFVEGECEQFYAPSLGRPSLTPGIYFRSLLVGYFEGIDSERGVAWRIADSLSLRRFLAIELDEDAPDHSTISRTRRLIDIETHRKVFTWALRLLAREGLLAGGTIGVDATTLEANAAMRSLVRRDTGEGYEEYLRRLALESGIETPTREQLAKIDKKRKNKASNVLTSARGSACASNEASGAQYREQPCQPSPVSQASKKLRAVCSIELLIGSHGSADLDQRWPWSRPVRCGAARDIDHCVTDWGKGDRALSGAER